MIEWAATNGKAVRQRSVRQETTMFKAGTLPLNMYRSSEYPKDKISFGTDTVEKEPVISATSVMSALSGMSDEAIEMGQAEATNEEARVWNNNEDLGVDGEDKEEYDTDDSDHSMADSDDDDLLDSLTFLRAVTTRSGRTVRVVHRE